MTPVETCVVCGKPMDHSALTDSHLVIGGGPTAPPLVFLAGAHMHVHNADIAPRGSLEPWPSLKRAVETVWLRTRWKVLVELRTVRRIYEAGRDAR